MQQPRFTIGKAGEIIPITKHCGKICDSVHASKCIYSAFLFLSYLHGPLRSSQRPMWSADTSMRETLI